MPFQRASHKNSVKNTCTYSTEVGQQSSKKTKLPTQKKEKRTKAEGPKRGSYTLHGLRCM